MLGQFSLPLPRSEKQRWISALCPSSPQEDKEVISEGEGSSLSPTMRATFPGLGTASHPATPRLWVPCCLRGRQGAGSAGLGAGGGSARPWRTGWLDVDWLPRAVSILERTQPCPSSHAVPAEAPLMS